MSPEAHYQHAERLLEQAAVAPNGDAKGLLLASAQVHATLATVKP